MKREGLSQYQVKGVAQEMADETAAPCIIYRQSSITGAKHFGVVTNRHVVNWQRGAAVGCVRPKEVGDAI